MDKKSTVFFTNLLLSVWILISPLMLGFRSELSAQSMLEFLGGGRRDDGRDVGV